LQESRLVLVVEDHVDERVVTRILLEHFGYRVSTAASTEEALRFARDRRPDLIVMDIMMPEVDGVEAVERLASDPRTADIPVLAYTAYRDICRDRLDKSVFAATLEKPAAPQELLSAVVNRIGEPHPGSPQGRP
jgi:CheY-like chemotaxis protein